MPVGVQIGFNISGAAAWAAEGGERRGKQLRTALRAIDKRVLSIWARTGGNTARPGLGDRFNAGKQKRYNFAPRSENDQKLKRRRGLPMAYVSARRKVHMRDLVNKQGSGHRVSSRNGQQEVSTSIRLPGARVLNLAQRHNPQYLTQFLNVQSPGFSIEEAWISKERQRLLDRWLADMISKAKRRGKRGKGRAKT
jgi:hypothetical protein